MNNVIYIVHVNDPWITLNMVYSASNMVITQGLRPMNFVVLNLFLFAIGNGVEHSICEDCYTSIMVIYLDQAKLETSS
jgi:hypothetical protein